MLAGGARDLYEMEQVIPGAIDDYDPITEAAELNRFGQSRAALRLLESVLEQEERCIDAWVHLGLVALNQDRPAVARPHYEKAVAIAEQTVTSGFGGVLAWTLIDNRPFLRALHGLGLCAWRQRGWDDAEAAFTARVWMDPDGQLDALACLHEVQQRRRGGAHERAA